MLCNREEFQRFVSTNLLFVILLVMQIARLIKEIILSVLHSARLHFRVRCK